MKVLGRILCAIGLHWGEWRWQSNFHSHHAMRVYRCGRCPHTKHRVIPLYRAKRLIKTAVPPTLPGNIDCGADRP